MFDHGGYCCMLTPAQAGRLAGQWACYRIVVNLL